MTAMTTATITPTLAAQNGNHTASHDAVAHTEAWRDHEPADVIEHLDVHFAGKGETAAIAELASRARSAAPVGSLLVGTVDGTLLAAASLTSGEVVAEPTPAGDAAAAVVRYRLTELSRRRRVARKAGTPS